MKNVSRTLIGVFMAVLVFGAAYAQFAKPEDAINYRKAVMTLIGNHFGRMAAVVKGQKPYDKAEFEKNAQLIQTLSALPWEAFLMPGTEKVDTGLKSLPLKDQSDFMSKADAFQKEAAKLAELAGSGDLSSIKSQFGAVGKACKNCHDQYRK
jgi:cytochrome c556